MTSTTTSTTTQEYKRPTLTLKNQILVGTLSGWTEIVLCQPIDTYKTGLQSANPVRFKQFFNAGLTHWYAGMTPMLVFRAIYISALKVSNESYKSFAHQNGADITSARHLMAAGAFAGVMATPLSCMSEWFKTQMQNNGLSLKSLLANRSSIRRSFNGFTPTTFREAGYGATLFGLIPLYNRALKEHTPDLHPHLSHLIAGMSAGVTGGLLTQPFDAIKTLCQERKEGEAKISIPEMVRKRLAQRGFMSLWAGAVPRCARLAIGTFILDRCISVYGDYFLEGQRSASVSQSEPIPTKTLFTNQQ